MKITFYKGCYSRYLSFENTEFPLNLSSEDKEVEWENNLPLIKKYLNQIVDKASPEQGSLNLIFRYFVEYHDHTIDYDQPVKEPHEEVVEKIKKYIKDIDTIERDLSFSILEIAEELIRLFHIRSEDDDNHHECEQCGDYNYEIFMEM